MLECAGQRLERSETRSLWPSFAEVLALLFTRYADDHAGIQAPLQHQVKEWYASLIGAPELQAALARCPAKHALTTPSWSSTLHQDPECHVGLVSVYQGQGIPLHDHTGSFGLSLVIAGSARIRFAQRVGIRQASGLTQIRMAGSQECHEQQVSWFDQQRNLHSIEAMTSSVQLLVVHMPPIDQAEQAFYFPLEDKPWLPGQGLFTRRIRVRYNLGH